MRDGEDYFSHEKETIREYNRQLAEALRDPSIQNVVADATHMTRGSRNKLFKVLDAIIKKENIEVVGLVMTTEIKICLERNENRTGRAYVPPVTIEDMKKHFEFPERDEPFDKVYAILINYDKISIK